MLYMGVMYQLSENKLSHVYGNNKLITVPLRNIFHFYIAATVENGLSVKADT